MENLRTVAQQVRESLPQRYLRIRQYSEQICAPLALEDYGIQTMPEVSPPKWHLAHTSWFFETLLLKPFVQNYQPFNPRFAHLFNSYYDTIGSYHPRAERGLLSRPTVDEIYAYRTYVDEKIADLWGESDHPQREEITMRIELGLNHEQQHQELMLTDIKHIFAYNPLQPVYCDLPTPTGQAGQMRWLDFTGGIKEIGHKGASFAFDNEGPRHQVYLADFRLASRLVTNGEYIEFIEAGGYQQSHYWFSDAWKIIRQQNWRAPLYWQLLDDEWWHMTLGGLRKVDAEAPVCHISYYEASAYAQWAGKRLPTEAEWEIAASDLEIEGNFRANNLLHPSPTCGSHPVSVEEKHQQSLLQIYGDVWEWTQSPYVAYPGYKPAAGPLGEYNGKFMSSQMVLRGGSCVTPKDHIRPEYRNFFYPHERWQFSGLRLAEDIDSSSQPR